VDKDEDQTVNPILLPVAAAPGRGLRATIWHPATGVLRVAVGTATAHPSSDQIIHHQEDTA
jgi:hypothetical protein